MASYIVMEPPAASDEEAVDGARLIRDGFSFPAFVVSPLWLLWHRLWIEAALFFAGSLAIVTAAEQAGLGPAGSALSFLLSLYVGLEGQKLRTAALRRRGWEEWGVVHADSEEDAEIRYASQIGQDYGDREGAQPGPAVLVPPPQGRMTAGPALGLLGYPGRT